MKVLFLMNGGFSRHSTSEHLLKSILEQLAADNNVHIIQMLRPDDNLVLPSSINAMSITTEGIIVTPQKKNNFVARYLNALKNYYNCRSAFKKHADSDVVFLQSTNVAGFAVGLVKHYLKNAKIVYNVQDIFPYNAAFSGMIKKSGIAFKLLAAIQRYGYNQSDELITISEDMRNTLVSEGIDAKKINVIYNWSYQDKSYDHLDYGKLSHMFNSDLFNVVYAGNIGVMQNVDILVDAANLMKNDPTVCFHIIGNGVYKGKLQSKVEKDGINNVCFWPMQPPELAPLIYSSADVNVIPLKKDIYKTALPSKTATCLACQKPIIFAIGRESFFGKRVEKETGCLITESDNPYELVDAIRKIQEGNIEIDTTSFFENNCSMTRNSHLYKRIILRKKHD